MGSSEFRTRLRRARPCRSAATPVKPRQRRAPRRAWLVAAALGLLEPAVEDRCVHFLRRERDREPEGVRGLLEARRFAGLRVEARAFFHR